MDGIALVRLANRNISQIEVSSPAFMDQGRLPAAYTADGRGTSPPLIWTGAPASAAGLVLIVEDADSPTPHPLVHAIAVNLAPGDGALAEGALNPLPDRALGPDVGINSFFKQGWLPPDPPPGHGPHRYVFQIIALSEGFTFGKTPGRSEVLDAIADRSIAAGLLIGIYERQHRMEVLEAEIPERGESMVGETEALE
jgi:hypothetical protein